MNDSGIEVNDCQIYIYTSNVSGFPLTLEEYRPPYSASLSMVQNILQAVKCVS